mmetsp:Transcript_71503/g.225902  ORF Transcript_71503/g.225902 Transcript_71503/m.225902 type:complete len:253 (-) Transcript_71503:261-1019(-)
MLLQALGPQHLWPRGGQVLRGASPGNCGPRTVQHEELQRLQGPPELSAALGGQVALFLASEALWIGRRQGAVVLQRPCFGEIAAAGEVCLVHVANDSFHVHGLDETTPGLHLLLLPDVEECLLDKKLQVSQMVVLLTGALATWWMCQACLQIHRQVHVHRCFDRRKQVALPEPCLLQRVRPRQRIERQTPSSHHDVCVPCHHVRIVTVEDNEASAQNAEGVPHLRTSGPLAELHPSIVASSLRSAPGSPLHA